MRHAKSLLVFITLVLTQVVFAEPQVEALRQQLDEHSTYAVTIEGRDEDGEFSALYYFSPTVRVVRIRDRNGKSVFEYDKSKVEDRVQVTRNGVAYRYRLDNPRIPFGFPNSLLANLLEEADLQKVVDEDGDTSIIFNTDKGELKLSALRFSPTEEDPDYARLRRYMAKVSEGP